MAGHSFPSFLQRLEALCRKLVAWNEQFWWYATLGATDGRARTSKRVRNPILNITAISSLDTFRKLHLHLLFIFDTSNVSMAASHDLAVAHHGQRYLRHSFDSPQAERLRMNVNILESYNAPAQTQPPYPVQEQRVLEHWRGQVLDIIQKRLARYGPALQPPEKDSLEMRRQASLVPDSDQAHCIAMPSLRPSHGRGVEDTKHARSHRAVDVPELLDAILEQAGLEAQLVAFSTSQTWRRSAVALIGSHSMGPFWHPKDEPIQYGERLTVPHSLLCAPGPREREEFIVTMRDDLRRRPMPPGQKYIYLAGKFTQQTDLPDDVRADLDRLDADQEEGRTVTVFALRRFNAHKSRDPPSQVYWLDMSQLRLNPYLLTLLRGRAHHRRGRLEVDLRPNVLVGQLIVDGSRYPTALLEYLGPMFFSQPPCKVLGIYRSKRDATRTRLGQGSSLQLLQRLHNKDGIRVGEVLAALEEHASAVLSRWRECADALAEDVCRGHWQEDIWDVPGVPRISLLLDNADMGQESLDNDKDYIDSISRDLSGPDYWDRRDQHPIHSTLDGHITRHCYMFATGWREEREGEWLPRDIMEPMESTVRQPINWNN